MEPDLKQTAEKTDQDNVLELVTESDDVTVDCDIEKSNGEQALIDAKAKQEKVGAPGRLKTKGSVVIHSRSAHDLFYGRRGDKETGVNQIVGLTLFASNTNNLSMLCRRDDPYAEAVLIEIEELFEDLECKLSAELHRLESLLAGMSGVVIQFHKSETPVSIPLEFGTPYGFIAARFLSKYDQLFTLAYSAKQVGLLNQSGWFKAVIKMRTKLRHIFHVSTLYRFGGASRDDIAANNAVARSVREKYGDLSNEILMREKRAQYVSHNSA